MSYNTLIYANIFVDGNCCYMIMKCKGNKKLSITEKMLRLKKLNDLLEKKLIKEEDFEVEKYKILKS